LFGIGGTELAIIAVFAFIIFGPDKVPELARTIGKVMRQFKRAQEDMERVIRAEVYTNNSPGIDGEVAAATHKDVSEQVEKATAASTIWASAEADDEEEDEE
jgi:sec-independent protein translocase protein TatB